MRYKRIRPLIKASTFSNGPFLYRTPIRSIFNHNRVRWSCPPLYLRHASRGIRVFSTNLPPLAQIDAADTQSLTATTLTATDVSLVPDSQPPPSERNDPQAWARLCEAYLPVGLRKPFLHGPDSPHTECRPVSDLLRLLCTARNSSKIDVIAHLALTEQRWDTALWIMMALLDCIAKTRRYDTPVRALSNLQWPISGTIDSTLDHLTDDTFSLDYEPPNDISHSISFTTITTAKDLASQAQFTRRERLASGQIWQTVGNLLLAAGAARYNTEGRHKIMSYVLRVLAHMHHLELIPEDVFRPASLKEPLTLQQPPLLSQLCSSMRSCLAAVSDSELKNDEAQIDTVTLSPNQDSPLGPALWLELVLWCCVRDSYLLEGAAIIDAMRNLPRSQSWSIFPWRQVVRYLEGADLKNRRPWFQKGSKALDRAISAEVIEALADGLITGLIRGDILPSGYSLGIVVERISVLKGALDNANIHLQHSSWDAKIARLADVNDFEVGRSPQTMEKALELADFYGYNANFAQYIDQLTQEEGSPTYIFDASAAVLGFYHRTLHAHIQSRDVGSALRLLARLQTLTDKNKSNSVQDFFAELKNSPEDVTFRKIKQGTGTEADINYADIFPGIQYPGYYPSIPIPLLADLLDLITEAQEFAIGRWMIYSVDPDEPLIGEHLHGDQVMAAALIRFAAATRDASLLSELTRAQTTSVSAKTLIALCDNHIQHGNWRAAAGVLSLIRDHSLYEWTAEDFAQLLRALIRKVKWSASATTQDEGYVQASSLLQRLLRGDLGQVWGPKFSELDSIVGVLSSMSEQLADVCSGLLIDGKQYQVDMDSSTFSPILQGAVEAFGSSAGRMLWDRWCRGLSDSRQVTIGRIANADESAPRLVSTLERFFGQNELVTPLTDPIPNLPRSATFKGYVIPHIETIRVIIQQALREHREEIANSEQPPLLTEYDLATDRPLGDLTSRHDVLDWAAQTLRKDFLQSESDIDYELEGYISAQSLRMSKGTSYGKQTLQIWRAFTGSRKHWALDQERRLRSFVEKRDERQVVLESMPSAERFLLHCLAADYGLVSESFGESPERAIKISKPKNVRPLPSRGLDEVVRRMDGLRPFS